MRAHELYVCLQRQQEMFLCVRFLAAFTVVVVVVVAVTVVRFLDFLLFWAFG